jgi:hypothetical protein
MRYFTISELSRSYTATKNGIDNTPGAVEKMHLIELIENLLDHVRYEWGEYCKKNGLGTGALVASSGYRCPQLNKLVGGAKASAHLYGYGADIVPANGLIQTFKKWLLNDFLKKDKYHLKYDQIILEKSSKSEWVHFGYKYKNTGRQRMQKFSLNV